MGVLWNKVWFDLWRNKVRTLLAVLSIAAGVFAIGTIFGMSDQLLSGMDAAHQSVTPSHINMYLEAYVDRATVQSLQRLPGILDVEPYNVSTVSYKVRPEDDWRQGQIVMRDDYDAQRNDVTQLKDGGWPRDDLLGIERLTSKYLQIGIGDSVIFKQGNREKSYKLNGLVRHPFVPPPDFGGPAYFFLDGEGMERLDVPNSRFSALLVRVTPYSAEYAKDRAAAIKEQLARQGLGVAATIYQDPSKHWGRMYIEGITVVMQMLAVVSLLLSVVLIFNTLTALITQQTNQIGILKAVGGKAGTIMQLYLAGVLAYGLLALVAALPLGVFLAFGITQSFLNLFNIDYDTFSFSTTAIVFQLLAALAVPPLAGLLPVLNGARITVRQAIATYGLGADFGSSALDRAVERIGQRLLPSHYATALGNMFRRKGRLALTQLVLVTAGSMYLVVMSLSSSMSATYDQVFAKRKYDVTYYFAGTTRTDRALEAARGIDGMVKAEPWYTMAATIKVGGQRAKEAGLGTEVDGIPSDSDFHREKMVAGRWLQPGDGRVIVMNRETAKKNNIPVGGTVTLDFGEWGESDWQVVGLYQVVFNGGGFANDVVYAPGDALAQATKRYNHATRLLVRTAQHDVESVKASVAQFKQLFEARNNELGYTWTENELRTLGAGQAGMAITMLLALAIVVAAVGGIGLMGALSISVVERTKEIGVLRAIGARSLTIMGMFVTEGVLQGVLSWAFSVFISLALAPLMADLMGQAVFSTPLEYSYNWSAAGTWLVVMIVLSALASILPARSATRISVRDSLAYA